MNYNPQGSIFSGIPTVVKNLLIINGLVFLFTWVNSQRHFVGDLENLLGLHYITSPLFRPWQLITHMFMHGSIGHILLNMFGLLMLGIPLGFAAVPHILHALRAGIGGAVHGLAMVRRARSAGNRYR